MSKADGGMMEISRIENLTQLAKENVNFSHHDLLGGFRSSNGTSWTVGAAFGAVTGCRSNCLSMLTACRRLRNSSLALRLWGIF